MVEGASAALSWLHMAASNLTLGILLWVLEQKLLQLETMNQHRCSIVECWVYNLPGGHAHGGAEAEVIIVRTPVQPHEHNGKALVHDTMNH